MSGGDTLEHECQTCNKDIFVHLWFHFSYISPTFKNNAVHKHTANINQVNGRWKKHSLKSNLNSDNLIAAAKMFDFK